MDRRDKSRRASSAPPSMVTLAAAAAAGEEADNDGAVTHVDEDTKPLNLGGAMSGGSSSLSPTAAVPVSARRGAGGGGSGGGPSCQAERCGANLTDARQYYRRHKVCEGHAKAPVVIVAGLGQRFCQQCSRFHELSEFDDIKKSCRKRLAGHNERRRKRSNDAHGGGAAGNGSGHTDQDGPSHPHSQLNNLHIR